jgi:hypothetical protein
VTLLHQLFKEWLCPCHMGHRRYRKWPCRTRDWNPFWLRGLVTSKGGKGGQVRERRKNTDAYSPSSQNSWASAPRGKLLMYLGRDQGWCRPLRTWSHQCPLPYLCAGLSVSWLCDAWTWWVEWCVGEAGPFIWTSEC